MSNRAERRREEREKRKKVIEAGNAAAMDDIVDRAVQAAADAAGISYEAMDALTDAENIVADAAGDSPTTPCEMLAEMSESALQMIIPETAAVAIAAIGELVDMADGDLDALVQQLMAGAAVRATSAMENPESIDRGQAGFFYAAALVAGVIGDYKKQQATGGQDNE